MSEIDHENINSGSNVLRKRPSRTLHIAKMMPTRMMIFEDEVNLESLDLPALYSGATFLKFGKAGFPHERKVYLSEDHKYIYWKAKWDTWPTKDRRIMLEQVTQIKKGHKSDNFNHYKKAIEVAHNVSFSLTYKKDGETYSFDLIAKSKDNFKKFYYGLSAVLKEIDEERKNRDMDRRNLKAKWDLADADKFGNLTKREVVNLIASLNLSFPSKYIYKFFDEVDLEFNGSYYGTIDFENFYKLMDRLRERPEMETLWDLVTTGKFDFEEIEPLSDDEFIGRPDVRNSAITIADFASLWSRLQHVEVTIDDALNLVHEVTPAILTSINNVSYHLFVTMLAHPSNEIFDLAKLKQYQTMSRPLSHYYIATSALTYLDSDHTTGRASLSRYEAVLGSGCRCVELRVWDGEVGEPVVAHQQGAKSWIPLIDQQKRIADIFVAVFGRMLLLPGDNLSQEGHLPSPEEIKYKVLLMSRRKRAGTEEFDVLVDGEGVGEGDRDDDETADDKTHYLAQYDVKDGMPQKPSKQSRGRRPLSQGRGSRVHPELAGIIYLDSFRLVSPNDNCPSDRVACISELQNQQFLALNDPETNANINARIVFNQGCLSRVYPKGVAREDSSNPDPMSAWASGDQLVALNYQTPDLATQINEAKFRENGRCGYVLKPAYMVSPATPAEPGVQLTLHILSAQQLHIPPALGSIEVMDTLVRVNISGLPCDSHEQETPVKDENNFNPVWDYVMVFDIYFPEVAQLTFRVYDRDRDVYQFIAYASIPLHCVRPGLRTVALYNERGQLRENHQICGSLCVRVQFKILAEN